MEERVHRVLPSEDLPAGTPTIPAVRRVRVGKTDMLLARLHGGDVVAFDTTCPHQGTSLEDVTEWEGNLRCPRHLYLYDPRTGENILPAREARPGTLWKLRPRYLPVYQVVEQEGWVWVDEEPAPPPAAYDPAKEQRPSGLVEDEKPADAVGHGPVEHPTQALRVRAGQDFEVVLSAEPRPGHFWQLEVSSECVAVVAQTLDPVRPSAYRISLSARSAGEASLRCNYARPWDTTPSEVRTFAVSVER